MYVATSISASTSRYSHSCTEPGVFHNDFLTRVFQVLSSGELCCKKCHTPKVGGWTPLNATSKVMYKVWQLFLNFPGENTWVNRRQWNANRETANNKGDAEHSWVHPARVRGQSPVLAGGADQAPRAKEEGRCRGHGSVFAVFAGGADQAPREKEEGRCRTHEGRRTSWCQDAREGPTRE